MIVAILGLGEAGKTLADDLLAVHVSVRGWDPNPVELPNSLYFAQSNVDAVEGADLILSVNWASAAKAVAVEVAPALTVGQIYADLNTASPQNKEAVATIIEPTGADFVDAAIMSPIRPKGLHSPVYASGSGAQQFHARLSPLGMPVTVLDEPAGSAATHKLVRSIVYKGIAAVVLECVEAGEKLGMANYARQQMASILQDESLIDHFVTGSHKHAKRRMHEMEAVVELLEGAGVSAFTSQASVERLKELQ
ncbi:MAG: NAD(P)-binding domain-containing protein [Chloroflexota bacterium]